MSTKHLYIVSVLNHASNVEYYSLALCKSNTIKKIKWRPPISKKSKCDQLCNPIVLPVMQLNEAPEAKVIAYWTSM